MPIFYVLSAFSVFCALTGGYKIQPKCRFSAQPIQLQGFYFALSVFLPKKHLREKNMGRKLLCLWIVSAPKNVLAANKKVLRVTKIYGKMNQQYRTEARNEDQNMDLVVEKV